MADLMQQARELLAAAYDEFGESRCAEWIRSGRHEHRAAIHAITAALRAAPECAWTYDTSTDSWDSACGEKWQFNDGGPAENNCRFCQGCGGRVAARPQEASDEQE